MNQYILLGLSDSKVFPKKSPISHQQLHQQRINHMSQLVKKDTTHHKLLLSQEEKNLSLYNKKTHDLTFYNLPFSIHQINKTDFLFKSLWASLFSKRLFSRDIFDTPSRDALLFDNFLGSSFDGMGDGC